MDDIELILHFYFVLFYRTVEGREEGKNVRHITRDPHEIASCYGSSNCLTETLCHTYDRELVDFLRCYRFLTRVFFYFPPMIFHARINSRQLQRHTRDELIHWGGYGTSTYPKRTVARIDEETRNCDANISQKKPLKSAERGQKVRKIEKIYRRLFYLWFSTNLSNFCPIPDTRRNGWKWTVAK